jgi:hypothetical protein
MKFIASLTMNASDLRQTLRLWDESGDPRKPFANVLVSPLFAQPSTMRLVREELKERRGSEVFFDSGGYYVQQGRLAYEDLYGRLMSCYLDNQWADWYVLPDWVPTTQDDPTTVEHKVRATITMGRLFYDEMPDQLKTRAVPVVQGHRRSQIMACMESYLQYAVGPIGFGSFSTSGGSYGVNTVTGQSVELLRSLSALARNHRSGIHLFGVSTPPILYLFHQLGISSFDSMAWMRAAAFGNVFLPFVRGYMTTCRTVGRIHIFEDRFLLLKELSGHRCVFCDDFGELAANRFYRIMHNLACVLDTMDLIQEGHLTHAEIMSIIAIGSPKYVRFYQGGKG